LQHRTLKAASRGSGAGRSCELQEAIGVRRCVIATRRHSRLAGPCGPYHTANRQGGRITRLGASCYLQTV
jgi:hypothetical protein